jgi:Cu(I)/Ag(I) efflux system membrane fusion protein
MISVTNRVRKEYLIGLVALGLLLVVGVWLVQRDWSASPGPVATEGVEFHDAGPFLVAVSVRPETPQVGENQIVIQVKNEDGEPVTDAEVIAVAEMPAMGSMPAMYAQADVVETAPGVYRGDFELTMAGEWPLAVEIVTEDGAHVDLTFEMATGREGIALATATPAGEIAYYTCPMHPSVKAAEPGQCPICGMDLVPVTRDELESGSIVLDEGRRQAIGVEIGEVIRKPFTKPIRLQGEVTYDPARLVDISLRFSGWIGDLAADYEGEPVEKGEILFTVYSPELLSLQEEFLQAVQRSRGNAQGSSLISAARKRLRLWGLNEAQIDWLAKREKAQDYVPIFAPKDGIVIERNVVNGSAFQAGERLLRLADLTQVWVRAFAYEQDLPLIERGMEALVTQPYLPTQEFPAEVMQVDPFVGAMTRTAQVRLQVGNEDGKLKPGSFANVYLQAELGEQLVIPEDAVLISGEKRIVFVDVGEGRLKPTTVVTGPSTGEQVVVLEGLSEGDEIVTSGNFLIASESKLRAGINQW